MVMCLNTIDFNYQNREKSRFCANCGIPVQGALLLGRYEIQALAGKDRSMITIHANDRHYGVPVTIRALLPQNTTEQERNTFLQDAELAVALSKQVHEPDSIRVIDYGQDGPIAFLVKSDLDEEANEKQSARQRMTVRVERSDPTQYSSLDADDILTEVRPAVPKETKREGANQSPDFSQPAFMPQDHQDWLAMGDRAYELGHYEDALEAYEAAIAEGNTSVEAWSGKGATLLHLDDPEEALVAFDQALALHERATLLSPNSALAWFDKGNDLRDLKRFAEALVDYDYALSLDPALAGAWYNRGNVLAAMRMYEDALESYDQALHDDDGLISAWYNKGSLLHELGRDQEALLAFDKAIALDPHYISAWNNKGLALFKLGHLDEALVAFDQATSFAPEEPDAWHNKAIVLEKLGRVEEAVSCQEWAQSLEQQVAG